MEWLLAKFLNWMTGLAIKGLLATKKMIWIIKNKKLNKKEADNWKISNENPLLVTDYQQINQQPQTCFCATAMFFGFTWNCFNWHEKPTTKPSEASEHNHSS